MTAPEPRVAGGLCDHKRLSVTISAVLLLIVAATYVVNAMDRTVFAILLPGITAEFGFSLTAGGFLATIFTLGLGIAGIPAGLLLDRSSRKAVAVTGILLYSAATVLTAFSTGFYDMALYRVVSGVGEAFQNAAIFTMAGVYFGQSRTLAFGMLNAAYGVGAIAGPRWGAFLMDGPGGWRLPLYVFGLLGLAGALVMQLTVPARFTDWGADDASTIVTGSEHIPAGLINRNTIVVALASIAGGVAGYGYLGLYPTFLRTRLAFSVGATGAAAAMYGLGALTGLFAGYLADRVNQKWLTILALAVLSLVGYAIFNSATTLIEQSALSFFEGVALSGFLYVNNYSLMQRSVRSAHAGSASGLFVSCIYLSGALSGYLLASLVVRFGWGLAAVIQMSLIPAAAIGVMLLFNPAETSCTIGVASQPRVLSEID